MASKLQRKLIRESRIRGLYARAVWRYYKDQELALYREKLKVDHPEEPDFIREVVILYTVSYIGFGFAYTKYMDWYEGVGEKLLFNYPQRGKVRAKDIIVTPK